MRVETSKAGANCEDEGTSIDCLSDISTEHINYVFKNKFLARLEAKRKFPKLIPVTKCSWMSFSNLAKTI